MSQFQAIVASGEDSGSSHPQGATHATKPVTRRSPLPLNNTWTVVLATAGLAVFLGMFNSALRPPLPCVHDEFSYLLGADTFSHGRVTNPTHPMWEHLESFHIIHQPTYTSKYPPGQALALSIAQRLTGSPLVAVWFLTALAVGCTCWMLRAWFSPLWAGLGGLLVALHPGIAFVWGQGYWGGALAMSGAALLFGALARLWRAPHWTSAVAMASGVVILANTRPFEGLLISLPVAVAMLWLLLSSARHRWRANLVQIVLPQLVVLTIGAAAMLYYNARVTGDPLRMPYQIHEQTYAVTPQFLWQPLRPSPEYHHRVMKSFWTDWAVEKYSRQQSPSAAVAYKSPVLHFFFTPVSILALCGLPLALRQRWIVLPLALMLGCFAVSLAVPAMHSHYLAPLAPLFFLLIIASLHAIYGWQGLPGISGKSMAKFLVAAYVLAYIISTIALAHSHPPEWAQRRQTIANRLESLPGKQLVLVSYSDRHNVHDEWVYNRADIDGAKVVWARTMGPQRDAELVRYFANRHAWRLAADDPTAKLVPIARP